MHEAARVGGKTAVQLEGTCPPDTVDIGTYCMESAPYPLTKEDLGKNNFIFASKTCEKAGGWLPSASELLGAAERVKLESTIHDSQLTATIDLDPTRGLKDEREMSSSLITTEGGSAAAGLRGGQRRRHWESSPGPGQPDPAPGQPAARIAAVRDGLQQPPAGGVCRLGAREQPRELPLRLQPVGRRDQQIDVLSDHVRLASKACRAVVKFP